MCEISVYMALVVVLALSSSHFYCFCQQCGIDFFVNRAKLLVPEVIIVVVSLFLTSLFLLSNISNNIFVASFVFVWSIIIFFVVVVVVVLVVEIDIFVSLLSYS